MNETTIALVEALGSVNRHVPLIASSLLSGTLPEAKQHEFARLLIELGELLHSHADVQEASAKSAIPAEGGRHVLRQPAMPTNTADDPPAS